MRIEIEIMQEQISRRDFLQRAVVASGVSRALTSLKPARAAELRTEPESHPLYFKESGHHLHGEFQDFWRRHQNGYLLGLPITEEMQDKEGRKIQYFRYARLEESPEDSEGVRLGNLTTEIYRFNNPTRYNRFLSDEFFRKNGGTDFFGQLKTDPILNLRDGWLQYTEKFLLRSPKEMDIPENLKGAYDYYRDYKLHGYPNLLWPDEIKPISLGIMAADRLHLDISPVESDTGAILFSDDLQDSQKRVEVEITQQRLTAYEGMIPVFTTLVSTGEDGFDTPPGNYSVLVKEEVMDYVSPFPERRNYLAKDVPFNLRVRWEGEFIHGTYWHDRFGIPTSAGCINLNIDDAYWMFQWARVGTPVSIVR